MNYCPSYDADRYFSDPDLNCDACGADEDEQADCDHCGGVTCLNCGYCPDCHPNRKFTVLPEAYFVRTCYHCKKQMQWGNIEMFSEAISGEPAYCHIECLEPAIRQNQDNLRAYEQWQNEPDPHAEQAERQAFIERGWIDPETGELTNAYYILSDQAYDAARERGR